MIADVFDDLFHGDWIEKLIGSLILAMVLALVVCVGWLCFYFADSVGTAPRELRARVLSREHHPAWTQVQTTMAGKTPITQVINHPESWSVSVITEEDEELNCSVVKSVFDMARNGIELTASVTSGRFSSSSYCKGAY